MSNEQATIRFDPHVHTEASYDAKGSVHEVLGYCHNSSLDAVAITDHDTTVAAREAIEVQELYDITVIPGVEISTADGHLLALNVVDRPPIGHSLSASIEWVRDNGGVAVIPHPFQISRHGVRKRHLEDCDGIEVFNTWSMTGIQNRRAEQFASANDYPQFGGSDAHEPAMVGQGYTELDVCNPPGETLSRSDIIAALQSGNTRACGQQTSKTRYLSKYSRSLRQHLSKRVG